MVGKLSDPSAHADGKPAGNPASPAFRLFAGYRAIIYSGGTQVFK